MDLFEVYVSNIIQQAFEDEEHIKLMEIESNDTDDIHAVKEEENDYTPQKLVDHFLMAFSDDEPEAVEKELSLAERLRAKIARMIKVRKGLTVDSGAADHVMPVGWLLMLLVVKSLGSIRGLHYVAADGTRIANRGQQLVKFMTMDGVWVDILFQIAAIHKPLVSVSKLNEAGYKVVFDEDRSYIIHKKSRKVINMRKERGVFIIDAFVPKNPEQGFKGRR